MIEVIIPVYKDFIKTKNCLNSVLRTIDKNIKIVIINDNTPEPKIFNFLTKISKEHNQIKLLNHTKNKGFINSINEGFNQAQGDVIILNSDTEVPEHWVEKLSKIAYSAKNIGTVSPFSNSAAFLSYPSRMPGKIIDNLLLQEINNYFERVHEEPIELISGHGFCMFIKREIIKKLKGFNEKVFGLGYGEENDFCFKVVDLGYKNLVATNLFVFHQDGASFGESKYTRIEEALKKLGRLHPRKMQIYKRGFDYKPFKELFNKVTVLRYLDKQNMILCFDSVKEASNLFSIKFLGFGALVYSNNNDEFSLFFKGKDWEKKLSFFINILKLEVKHFGKSQINLSEIEYITKNQKNLEKNKENIQELLNMVENYSWRFKEIEEENTRFRDWIKHLEKDINFLNNEIKRLQKQPVKKLLWFTKKQLKK